MWDVDWMSGRGERFGVCLCGVWHSVRAMCALMCAAAQVIRIRSFRAPAISAISGRCTCNAKQMRKKGEGLYASYPADSGSTL